MFSALLIALIIVHCFRLRPYNERASDVVYVALDSTKSALNSILSAMQEYAQIEADFDAYIKQITYTKAPKERQIANIVLIIGESVQRNKMQIYGYSVPNTPILSAIHAQNSKNLFIFSDVVSSQVTTFESLSQALTFANQDNLNKKWFEYLNIIDAMRLGGYKSVVISNQERFSLWSKATTTIFSRANRLLWSADSAAGKRLDTMGFDEAILPLLDNALDSSANVKSSVNTKSSASLPDVSQDDLRGSILDEKSGLRSHEQGNKTSSLLTKRVASLHDFSPKDDALFLTLHLMGSHVAYKNRYPKHFEKFSSSDIAHTENPKAKGDLAEYANSILYTDSIIGEVIRRFADKDSIVIYISDHGNDVWDSGSGSLRLDNNITRYMVEVPFVVYVSDIFKVRHSRIYKQIAESTKKPFMLDDLIHALIDIAGFRIEGYESARSIFSKDFNANRARLLGTKASVDYDKKLKSKQHT